MLQDFFIHILLFIVTHFIIWIWLNREDTFNPTQNVYKHLCHASVITKYRLYSNKCQY